MKKQYEMPVAEKIEFCYRDQVVASGSCQSYYVNITGEDCSNSGQDLIQKETI